MFLIIIEKDKKEEVIFKDEYNHPKFKIIDKEFVLSEGYYLKKGNEKIETNHSYLISNDFEDIKIFVYKDDKGIRNYDVYQRKNFIISSYSGDVITHDPFLRDKYLRIEGNSIDTNIDDIYLASRLYCGQEIQNGDLLEVLGFKCYIYDDFIYLNAFYNQCQINKIKLKEKIVKIKQSPIKINNYHDGENFKFEIEQLTKFNPPRNNKRDLLSQLGPAITMALTLVGISSINIYSNYLLNGFSLSLVAMGLMPLTIILSGIIWPLIISKVEKERYKKQYALVKKEYLNYLDEYKKRLVQNISKELEYRSRYYFKAEDINRKLFYVSKTNEYFLKISLGRYNKHYDFECQMTNDEEIDKVLTSIKYHYHNVNDYPLYLDLKNNQRITVKTKNPEVDIKRFILELCCKHHYNDILMVIYSKEIIYDDYNHLPHLFYQEKRYTLNNERQLQALSNLKIDRPIILLMNGYCDVVFKDKNIHQVLFAKDDKVLKDSDVYIDLCNTVCSLINKEKWQFLKDTNSYDYRAYFEYISRSMKFDNVKEKTFMDLYPNLNIEENYKKHDKSLKAYFSLCNNEVLDFDLHEKKDGPHGLIAGMTGSGKSELLVSLLLSLFIRYSPIYLNVILVDYKGAGLIDSLSCNDKTLPHIVASLSNLDESGFDRLTVAIDKECRKRQILFKKLTKEIGQSIMSIDDYQENYKQASFEELPHILIVVDEFAQLKKSNPEVIKELISFSRIGRSLGLHLILATQKPSGVIDDEIWSNSHFKIALKLNNTRDSYDVIKNEAAAYLTKPGEFYLSVDENIIKAKAIYTKKDIYGNDDYLVAILNQSLEINEKRLRKKAKPFYESTYICQKIMETCNSLNLSQKKLIFEKPISMSKKELLTFYKKEEGIIMGEIDDYLNANRDILINDLNESIFIYSNREHEIEHIINDLYRCKKKMIIISVINYQNPFVIDSLLYSQSDDINYLFEKMLEDVTSDFYLLIEDLNTLLAYDERYLDYLLKILSKKDVCAYNLIILNKSSLVNFKLLNHFRNKYVIDICDNQDIVNIYGKNSKYKAKSYFFKDEAIPFVECKIEPVIEGESLYKNYIQKIPENLKMIANNLGILIGFDIKRRKEIFISYKDRILICSYDESKILKYQELFQAYSNIEVSLYTEDLLRKGYNKIIWLGKDIECQKLFYFDQNITMLENDAYYINGIKGTKIKIIDE